MQLTRKITSRTIGCDLGKANFMVMGDASAIETGESEYGPFVRLFGTFKAKNLASGKDYYSPQCILPGIANDMIAAGVKSMGEKGGKVRFAVRLWNEEVPRTADNMIGFEWRCEVLGNLDAFRSLDDFEKELLMLAAPATAEAPKS